MVSRLFGISVWLSSTEPLGTNFTGIWIKIHHFSCKKIHFNPKLVLPKTLWLRSVLLVVDWPWPLRYNLSLKSKFYYALFVKQSKLTTTRVNTKTIFDSLKFFERTFWQSPPVYILFGGYSGIIICMRPPNERWRFFITSSLIGWAHVKCKLTTTRVNTKTIFDSFKFFERTVWQSHPVCILFGAVCWSHTVCILFGAVCWSWQPWV